MHIRNRLGFVLLASLAAVPLPAAAHAQTTPPERRAQLAFDYDWVHSNAPTAQCGCFSLNGGSATFAWPVRSGRFAFAGDLTAANGSASVSGTSYGLTMTTFTVGGRYLPPTGKSRFHPFAEALAGLAHTSGPLVASPNPGAGNAGSAFAANLGGGVDLGIDNRFAIRLFQADYLLTTFDNGSNNHQNQPRISAGVVLYFH
jgi:outer membrane immunogenic protein